VRLGLHPGTRTYHITRSRRNYVKRKCPGFSLFSHWASQQWSFLHNTVEGAVDSNVMGEKKHAYADLHNDTLGDESHRGNSETFSPLRSFAIDSRQEYATFHLLNRYEVLRFQWCSWKNCVELPTAINTRTVNQVPKFTLTLWHSLLINFSICLRSWSPFSEIGQ